MKLGIISDAHHYYDRNGQLCTLTLLARQFEQWARLFDEVIVCAPLLPGDSSAMQTPYLSDNIRLLPVPVAGGNTISAKLDLLIKSPIWVKTLRELLNQVDAIHVRCPNNISILGLLMLETSQVLRQAIYTGSWLGHPGDPLTYRFQRFFLKKLFRGPVAVYGDWPGQPLHILPSFSPSYSRADWEAETEQVCKRLERLEKLTRPPSPVRLMSVGLLNKNKNQALIIQSMHYMAEQGIDCVLDLLGDGDQRRVLEKQVSGLGLKGKVFFHGNVAHSIVRGFYRQADFVIQAPYSEGFGKVPIEAFFHGVVPILSDVDMSPQIVGNRLRGRCFPQGDAQSIASHVSEIIQNPVEMTQLITNGRAYAFGLTLESWRIHIRNMLNANWNISLGPQGSIDDQCH